MTGTYRVTYPAATIELLRRCQGDARRFGIESQLLDELGELDRRLRTAPEGLGEELFYWRHMDALQFLCLSPLLVCTYAVHQADPIVFVQSVRPRDNGPLGEG